MPISLPRWWPKRREPAPPSRRVGLALSGGAARGVAHLGVLEVLLREQIHPDVVTGVSAGSVVGALYCAGVPLSQMVALAQEMQWRKVARPCRPRLSLFDTTRLETYLDEMLEGKTFRDLAIPFAVLAVDILTSEVVTLNTGSVAHAVRASCAIPGLFSPVEWGEHLLVDGGVLNNVPVNLARQMGADYVIASSLSNQRLRHSRPHNVLEMWMVSLDMLARTAQQEAALADCMIQLQIEEFGLTDFAHAAELQERGRQAAEAQLPKLRADLGILWPAGQAD